MRASWFQTAAASVGPRQGLPGQDVSRYDRWSHRALAAVLFAPMPWVMQVLAGVLLGGIRVRHLERFPSRGPVLLVANHPATWIDVLVLHVALGRRLHFLANEKLFRPRVRAWLLRLYGALPVAHPDDGPGREARNAHTFRRCRRLLERGEVVAIFPEGVSATDRSLRSFRTGAARLAFESRDITRPTQLIPVGIHYVDRVRFRTRVVVSVGRSLRLPAGRELDERGLDVWIGGLTARLRGAVESLILDLPEPTLRRMVEEVAPLVPRGSPEDPAMFERSRRLAQRLITLRRDAPSRFAQLARHARRYRRLREALRLEPVDTSGRSRGWYSGLTIAVLVGAAPAFAGFVLNALPALVTERVARGFDPTRVALFRIGAGWVCFAPWYAVMAVVAGLIARSGWAALAAPLVATMLGFVTLFWSDAWRELYPRLRWRWLARQRPESMARLRQERAELLRLLERAPSPRRAAPVRKEVG